MDDIVGQKTYMALGLTGRTCGAPIRDGSPCGKAPLVGALRCKLHGGGTEGRKERLLAMVDPAFAALMVVLELLKGRPTCPQCGRSDADRDPKLVREVIRAAEAVLNRTGFGPHATVDITRDAEPVARIVRVIIDPSKDDVEGVLLDESDSLNPAPVGVSPAPAYPLDPESPSPALPFPGVKNVAD